MEAIARQDRLCLDEAALPRRLLARGALLAFLAGVLFLIGLILSQPAQAAVTDTPGTPAAAGAVAGATGAVPGAAGAATGTASTASQAGTTATTQAVSQAAGQVSGLAGSATSTASQAGTAATGSANGTLASTAGAAASQVSGAAGQVAGLAGSVTPGSTAPGGTPQPPHRHHGRTAHRHHDRRGHLRRRGTPGGQPGRLALPTPGPADRLVPGTASQPNVAAHPAPHGTIAAMDRRDHPANPAPVLPVPPATGSPAGSGIEAHTAGHAAAGVPTLSAAAAGAAARIPARHRDDWYPLLRDRRGPHRPG